MMNSTTNFTVNTLPLKKDIVTRLFKDGHINLDEVLALMNEPKVNLNPVAPVQPVFPQWEPKQWDIPLKNPWDTWDPLRNPNGQKITYCVKNNEG